MTPDLCLMFAEDCPICGHYLLTAPLSYALDCDELDAATIAHLRSVAGFFQGEDLADIEVIRCPNCPQVLSVLGTPHFEEA